MCKQRTCLHVGSIWSPSPPPGGLGRGRLAGGGWEGGGARGGWAASGAQPAGERRPPLGGSGPRARQGRWSFLFTPIPAGGLLVKHVVYGAFFGLFSQNGTQKYHKSIRFSLNVDGLLRLCKMSKSIGPRAFRSVQKS